MKLILKNGNNKNYLGLEKSTAGLDASLLWKAGTVAHPGLTTCHPVIRLGVVFSGPSAHSSGTGGDDFSWVGTGREKKISCQQQMVHLLNCQQIQR